MIAPKPTTLQLHGVQLEPLTQDHADGLARAAADGALWTLTVTSVPETENTAAYIAKALRMQQEGSRLPFAVRDLASGAIVGSTSFHDIVPELDRLEIGYTWYAQSWQRSHLNTSCKLLLLAHAFDTLGCAVVGLRTDHLNFASQRAIERLGARRDGVLRHHALRRDGSVRDTVMYSILAAEWPDVQARLRQRLQHHAAQAGAATPAPPC